MAYKNKEAQKEYQRKWMAKRREEVLANKTCNHCSAKENLNFANVKGKGKAFSLSYSKAKLDIMIANALILCDDCSLNYIKAQNKLSATIHGHAGTRSSTYMSWRAMIERCNNPAKDNYKWYGGKGVTVCERWEKFENFLADMGERPNGMTLDRIDPFGNYEPSNCRWATPLVQGRNKRKNVCTKM